MISCLISSIFEAPLKAVHRHYYGELKSETTLVKHFEEWFEWVNKRSKSRGKCTNLSVYTSGCAPDGCHDG